MKVAIHQSQYLPWPPYFRKIAAADVFVVMDSVQYQKNGVQNRNQVRNKDGAFWLTIPVTGHLEDTIAQKKLVDDRWADKHWKSLQAAYARAPHWAALAEPLRALYERRYETLGAANDAFFSFLVKTLGITAKVVKLSELTPEGTGSALVLSACQALKADRYVSGTGAKAYLDEAAFKNAGIAIDYLESRAPAYPQFHGGTFVPGLSVVDMLANVGPEGCGPYLHA
jgi:hypothetical protein